MVCQDGEGGVWNSTFPVFTAGELFPAGPAGMEGFPRGWGLQGAAGEAQEPLGSVPAEFWGFSGALGAAEPTENLE